MTGRWVIGGIALMALVVLIGAGFIIDPVSAQPEAEITYDRIMRTQTIRCGYGAWPPFISKDPVTGKMSGIFYEYTEALGQALHLKIVWSEEFGTGEFIPALKSKRIDAMCASIWPSAARAREIDFVRPIFFSPLYIYVRSNDHRFDVDFSTINSPDVTIVSMDGEIGGMVATADFPQAKRVDLPQNSSVSEFFVNIAMKKADITIASPAMFDLYDVQNQGLIRRLQTLQPVRVFGNTIAVDSGEDKLRRMLDTATDELITSGTIEKILKKYDQYTKGFLRASLGYQP